MKKKEKVLALIPARLKSQRLPKKVILLIEKIPIIIHVYRRVLMSKKIDDVIICCDDKKIYDDKIMLKIQERTSHAENSYTKSDNVSKDNGSFLMFFAKNISIENACKLLQIIGISY